MENGTDLADADVVAEAVVNVAFWTGRYKRGCECARPLQHSGFCVIEECVCP